MALARSKYPERSPLAAAGSRFSENGVKPTRSQNSTETWRTSVGVATTVCAGRVSALGEAEGSTALATTLAPHEPQNLLPDPTGAPQAEQTDANGVPQSSQNRLAS